MKKRVNKFLALALILAMAMPNMAFAAASANTVIDIYHLNDTHSRVDNYPTIATYYGAADFANKNSILLDAGDTLHGQTIATVEKGESIVKIMNAVGFSAMTPGNHDFNYGYEQLLTLRDQMNFPLLSCNVYTSEGRLLEPYRILKLKDADVAVIGVSTPSTPYTTHPDNVIGLEFRDPVAEVRKAVKEVGGKADAIVVLAHVGLEEVSGATTEQIAQQVDGIDAIIDGHSHSLLPNGKVVNGTVIASTGEYANNLGHVSIKIGGYNKPNEVSAELIPVATMAGEGVAVADTYAPKKEVVDVINSIKASQSTILKEVISKTNVELIGEKAIVRTQNTNLSDAIADIVRLEAKADIAFHNGGNVRATIPVGDITRGDIINVLPFGNYIVTKEMTGADVVAAIEHGFSFYPELAGGFPQLSGLKVTVDAAKESGSRVQEVLFNGAPIELEKTYLVATNDFIAAAGDKYDMFAKYPVKGEFSAMDEVVVKHLKDGYILNEAADDRMTILNPAVETPEKAPAVPTEVTETTETTEVPTEVVTEVPAEVPTEVVTEVPAEVPTEVVTEVPAEVPTEVVTEVPVEVVVETPTQSTATYKVQKGDTLSKIAKTYGTTWQNIYALNKNTIKNPNRISVGQVIVVKAA